MECNLLSPQANRETCQWTPDLSVETLEKGSFRQGGIARSMSGKWTPRLEAGGLVINEVSVVRTRLCGRAHLLFELRTITRLNLCLMPYAVRAG